MRVGIFTDSYFPQISGVATSIKVLKEELEAQGHDVIIFTTTDPKAVPEEGIVRLTSIPFLSFKDRRIAIKGFSKALKEAKKYHIDIVHTHTEFSLGLAGKYVGYMLDIPVIHTYHTMYEQYLHYLAKGKLLRPKNVKDFSRMFCNRTSGVIVPSQLMKDKLASYHVYKEIRVIPTGVPIPEPIPGIRKQLRRELGLKDDAIVLLSLSRVAYEKNLHKVIEAFPSVIENHPNACLIFVGDGPARHDLETMVEDSGLTPYIQFVGEVDNKDVNGYYQMADLYVNASETETQGLTYLESIVNGCPLIAKRNDYLDELIRNPNLGELFDTDEELAPTLVRMISHLHDEGQEFSNSGNTELLREISSPTFAKKVISYYKTIINDYYFDTETSEPRSFTNPFYSKIKK